MIGGLLWSPANASADPPPPTSVSLVADHNSVTAGDEVHLTATANSEVSGTGYMVKIFKASNNEPLVNCGSGTVCEYTETIPWSESATATDRQYIARVRKSSGDIAATSALVTVFVLPYRFTVDLSMSAPSGPPGSVHYTATATINRSVPSGHMITILNADSGTFWIHCGTGTTCATSVTAPGTYQAVVRDQMGRILGRSYAWSLVAA